MKAVESFALGYLLNSVWQVPLVFAAAWVAARMARPAGPRMEHRVWVGALLLQAVLPLCHFDVGGVWRQVWSLAMWSWGGVGRTGDVRMSIGDGVSSGVGVLRFPAELLALIAVSYGCFLLYLAGRLGWGLWRTNLMRREARPLSMMSGGLARKARSLGRGHIRISTAPLIAGPVTVGVFHRVLLLPVGFVERVDAADLEAALAHEFAHIERRDFAKNLIYEVLSLPIAYHPLLWLTRARLAGTREMICDGMAADAVAGRESYVRSLLRLASMLSDRMPARTLHAIGIFDANILERRIMNLTGKSVAIRGTRRIAIAVACGAVAVATCASAVALRVDVDSPAKKVTSAETGAPARLTVKASDMIAVSKKQPVYPAEAKAAKDTVDGAVILAVTIGKDGLPEHIAVKQSLRGDYDRSSLDAVKEWRWNPYLLNGNPVEVDTTVTVIYSIEQ